jgi:hypothetical protein
MQLLTVGDSFTYGAELADPQTSAWPGLLAKRLGYELITLARPGSGNSRMIRQCIEQVDSYDMVVIAWSHFARIEMADEGGFFDIWPGISTVFFKDNMPYRIELINYITQHHNDGYLYRQYLINIILLQNFLKANNKRYIMLDSFGNHQANERTSASNQDLLSQIDATYYLGWPDESMMEWTFGAPKGPKGHFLEQGHAIIADKIYKFMEQLSWVN